MRVSVVLDVDDDNSAVVGWIRQIAFNRFTDRPYISRIALAVEDGDEQVIWPKP